MMSGLGGMNDEWCQSSSGISINDSRPIYSASDVGRKKLSRTPPSPFCIKGRRDQAAAISAGKEEKTRKATSTLSLFSSITCSNWVTTDYDTGAREGQTWKCPSPSCFPLQSRWGQLDATVAYLSMSVGTSVPRLGNLNPKSIALNWWLDQKNSHKIAKYSAFYTQHFCRIIAIVWINLCSQRTQPHDHTILVAQA